MQDLVNVLQHLDRDADGRLSFDEFAQGISRLGINLHEGELQVSCAQFALNSLGCAADALHPSLLRLYGDKWKVAAHPPSSRRRRHRNESTREFDFHCTFTALPLHVYYTFTALLLHFKYRLPLLSLPFLKQFF